MSELTISISGSCSNTCSSFSKRLLQHLSSPSILAIYCPRAFDRHLFRVKLSPLLREFLSNTLLAFLGYKDIRKADDPVINLACNMSMISTALYCLSGVTSGIFIGRLPIYCSLYGTGILLPWELEHIFTKKLAGMVFICMIGGYLVFYYYQTHFVWGVL